MEVLLPCAMDFEVDVHLPVLEEARLDRGYKEESTAQKSSGPSNKLEATLNETC